MSAESVTEGIPAGYKQTEVGVIPEDWDVLALGNIIEYVKGFAFSAHDYQLHGIRIIRVSDTTYDGIKEDESVYIDEKKAKGFKKWSLREGDLIISTVGSKPPMYDSLVGKATIVRAKDVGALLNQNAVIIRSRKWSLGGQYLLHNHLKQKRYLSHIEKIFRGNANQASITLKELFEYPIPLPPTLAEQEAIAHALTDSDALIESLEQLIAKKRQIKQGAMQDLLTGKRRLPGFEVKPGYKQTEVGMIPEDWNLQPLGGLVTFLDGKRRPVKDADRTKMQGSIPYYGASGIIDYVNDYLFDEDLILLGEDGENILSRNCRLAFRISGKTWVNNHAHVLRPNPDVSIGYLTDYLESLNYEQFNSGTAQPKLNKQTCYSILISLPPTKNEQAAIATILSDMDSEITVLEEKLAKTRQLKQGMMQELLTGRIRLV